MPSAAEKVVKRWAPPRLGKGLPLSALLLFARIGKTLDESHKMLKKSQNYAILEMCTHLLTPIDVKHVQALYRKEQ